LLIDGDDAPLERRRKKERVIRITFEVSTPYDEFDESSDLVNLLQALVNRLGGKEMEPTGVEEGSTLVEVEMTLEQFLELAEAYADGRLDDLNIESIGTPDDLLEEVAKAARDDDRGRRFVNRRARLRKRQELQDRLQRALLLLKRKQHK
jgi:hypothetical protein